MARAVMQVEAAVARVEADGLPVRRALPLAALPHANPFVLIEDIGPVDLANEVLAAQRPARGFEEVTWVLAGAVEHVRREAAGDVATPIAANQAEWLTAGRGDVYRERFAAAAGTRTLRIWIALPRRERNADRQFVVARAGTDEHQMWTPAGAYSGPLRIDLLAGRLLGARARIQPRTRTTVARVRIPADTTFVHAVDSIEPGVEAQTVVLYGLSGQAMVGPEGPGGRLVRAQELAVLTPPPGVGPMRINSDEVRIQTRPGETFDVLWLSGFPAGLRADEPFVQRGTVVMRTEEEILQAIEDYRTGRLGTLV